MKITPYLNLMAEKIASDLYFTTGAFVSMKVDGATQHISKSELKPGTTKQLAYEVMSEQQIKEFELTKEMNLGLSVPGGGRYRVNIYYQRGEVSMVIRYIKCEIPSIDKLGLPEILRELVMKKNGLVLMVGSTGSGKSTTLASMIEFRNQHEYGHILTIEDPIEYVFSHKKSIIGQREVGLDTLSYDNALREAMREAPDVIMIGEIRDKLTMEAAMTYADTGHLCLSTLHAVNANQALDRMLNLFPSQAKNQVLMDLSLNLAAIISQRLVPASDGGRIPAVEILLNTPYISELIRKGEFAGIKEVMEKGAAVGMQTFDQCLHELYRNDMVSMEDALNFADSRSNLEWQINFGGQVKSTSEQDSKTAGMTDTIIKKSPNEPSSLSAAPGQNSGELAEEMPVELNEEVELKGFEESQLGEGLKMENILDADDDEFFSAAKSMFE
jgi:twitching motility protein PilU